MTASRTLLAPNTGLLQTITRARRTRSDDSLPPRKMLMLRIGCIVLLLITWQVAVVVDIIPRAAIAAPTDIVVALGAMFVTPTFWSSFGATMFNWGTGLGIAIVIAVPLGMLLGASTRVYRMFRFTIDFLRTIPPVALIPLVLLIFGATPVMAIVLIVFGASWPLLLQAMYGVHEVDPVARDVARSYRWRRRDRVFLLVLPSAAPFLATGLRIAATMSLLMTIGAELIGGAPGLGKAIGFAQNSGDIPQVHAYVTVIALLGVMLNLVLARIERSVLRWLPRNR